MKARIFVITKPVDDPTAVVPVDEKSIKASLILRTIKRWMFIRRDKDKWLPSEKNNPDYIKGGTKPPYY